MKKIGDRIKEYREEIGMTQTELADLVGTTKQNIYKYENGIITNIPSDKIEAMAKVFNVSPGDILGWHTYTIPSIGMMLCRLRKNIGLTIEKLSELLNVDTEVIMQWEKGDILSMPTMKLKELAKILNFGALDLREIQVQGSKINWYSKDTSSKPLYELDAELADMLSSFNQKYVDPQIDSSDPQVNRMIIAYKKLNSIGKAKALERIEELTMIPDYKK